jgi:hypothetical protein
VLTRGVDTGGAVDVEGALEDSKHLQPFKLPSALRLLWKYEGSTSKAVEGGSEVFLAIVHTHRTKQPSIDDVLRMAVSMVCDCTP